MHAAACDRYCCESRWSQQAKPVCVNLSLSGCMQITEDDEQRTFHFECSSSEGPLGGLQADIVASKRRAGAAEVVFRKDVPLTDDDIAAMSSAMRTANTLIKPVGSTLAWAIRARGLLQTPSHACRADIPCCQCVSAFAPLHTCWSWFKSSSYQSLLCCFTYHS